VVALGGISVGALQLGMTFMAVTQENRRMRVTTPLGPDKLLLVDFNGSEAISRLFQFNLVLLAENTTTIVFDQVIGQPILVEIGLPGGKKRHFHGICSRLSEGKRDATFTRYTMEVVPKLWLLSRRVQSRIFQQITVPDILKKVLAGLDVKWDLKGKYHERDYCVQYRESDFAFAARMMEEEGIYYYFAHSDKGHTLVVADTPQGHEDVPVAAKAIYEELQGGNREDLRVTEWEKVQELRSGKVTLWDNCFELPQQNLEAQKSIQESVAVGKITHKLKVADNEKLELYDFPGAYAQRFDGIDPGGGDRAADLKKIFEDNARVAKLRMEQEAAHSVEIRGGGNCGQFTAGHKFDFERHFNADGVYVLTSVNHFARLAGGYRTGDSGELSYENRFTCIPIALPYRPPLATPKPTVGGTQTATVVGPAGEKIFCDKYGRVKVQFHWDRQGKKDANSSCWVRVSQNWGGANWGGMFIPHVGQEVIVDFEEGDPDSPLIVGRVYNAEAMPPMELPAHKTKSAIRDHGGNEMIMEGDDGKQRITMFSPHSQTKFSMGAPNSPRPGFSFTTEAEWNEFVKSHKKVNVDGNLEEYYERNYLMVVKGDQLILEKGNYTMQVDGHQEYSTKGNYVTHVTGTNETVVHGSNTTTLYDYSTTKIFGMETTITVGAKNEVLLAANQKLTVGTLIEVNQTAVLMKVPEDSLLAGFVNRKIGSVKEKIGDWLVKAGAIKQKINSLQQKLDSYEGTVSGSYKLTASPIFMESKSPMDIKAPDLKLDTSCVEVSGDLTVNGDSMTFGSVFGAKK
jgi:type VI secretion system secreted protein VgrG